MHILGTVFMLPPVQLMCSRTPDPLMCPSLPVGLTAREEGAAEVLQALFGGTDRAFGRQAMSESEVDAAHPSRGVELTYGEFDLGFFFELLHRANPRKGERFVDIGSGCGRLVFAAALAHDFELAVGIELLSSLHNMATRTHSSLHDACGDSVSLAPCRFLCEEVETGLPQLIPRQRSDAASDESSDAAIAFVYASCWPSVGPYLTELSATLAAALPHGSRVICVDKQLVDSDDASCGLQWRFELLGSLTRGNYDTGESIGYVYRHSPPSGSAAVANLS